MGWVPHCLPPKMESSLTGSSISSIQRACFSRIDQNLALAFAERCHSKTLSLHMSFSGMGITLNNFSCLLHLLVKGEFRGPRGVTEEDVVGLVVDYLGVTFSEVAPHVRSCMGAYYKLEWMYNLFRRH